MHIPNTPESLLPRSDSKNPAATCRGLTTNGRPCRRSPCRRSPCRRSPCRRSISKSPQASPSPSPRRGLSPQPALSPDAFCWQHQEQATPSPSPSPQRVGSKLQERTSIDTLIDRLGVIKRWEQPRKQVCMKGRKLPTDFRFIGEHSSERPREGSPERQRPRKSASKKTGFWGSLCCFGEAHERRAPRPKPKPPRRSTAKVPSEKPLKAEHSLQMKQRPPIERDPFSRTGELLSLIPNTASPEIASLLLKELAKPFSEADDEGFIYMFWLTPESLSTDQPDETASTLLSPSKPKAGQRRTSEVLNTFAATASTGKKTILLKIGRAQNVHRRLNQWNRQCGYNLSLVRYYPYQSTTLSSSSVNQTPRKVPNVNRIERLIHIELDSKRVKGSGKCGACNREHKEWFEVDATKNGVKAVDEVIRRWVEWGEKQI